MLPSEPTPALESFLDRALPRIRCFMIALGGGGAVLSLVFGWRVTAGFVVGAVISYINQRSLERGIAALGERITNQQSGERGGGIVLQAAMRYVLIAAGAYVIFNVSLAGLYGFLAGVCLPFAAIACEAAVEVFVMLRRS
jgi:hypothetical protein